VLQLIPVDSESTMDEVAQAAAHHSVGRRVKARPGHVIRVRRPGSNEPFPRTMRVSEAGIKPMESLECIWESRAPLAAVASPAQRAGSGEE
jgi:toluene monooxygenase system protein B